MNDVREFLFRNGHVDPLAIMTIAVVFILIGTVIALSAYQFYRLFCVKKNVGSSHTVKVSVVRKKYEPMLLISSVMIPPKYRIILSSDGKSINFDSETLYKSVKENDSFDLTFTENEEYHSWNPSVIIRKYHDYTQAKLENGQVINL